MLARVNWWNGAVVDLDSLWPARVVLRNAARGWPGSPP